jgi:hypothetical protein
LCNASTRRGEEEDGASSGEAESPGVHPPQCSFNQAIVVPCHRLARSMQQSCDGMQIEHMMARCSDDVQASIWDHLLSQYVSAGVLSSRAFGLAARAKRPIRHKGHTTRCVDRQLREMRESDRPEGYQVRVCIALPGDRSWWGPARVGDTCSYIAARRRVCQYLRSVGTEQ